MSHETLYARVKELEAQLAAKQSEWPDDAPEWADFAVIRFGRGHAGFQPDTERVIYRHQTPKLKVDWSQLAPWALAYYLPTISPHFPSLWIPWNVPGCRDGMAEGRECPVPNGVIVTAKTSTGGLFCVPSEKIFWGDTASFVVAFQITGIADDREA